MKKYIPSQIESTWQKKWREDKLFSPDMDKAKKPYYSLMMFPYPSAEGLHVGNMYAFTGSDIYSRFMRMKGVDVFEPIGLDGFGIHSENYAIQVGRHPKEQAKISEKNFYRQLRATGNAYDWSRTVETYDPDYYKWTQWIFIQMFKAGLAYRARAPVNFCPSCKTVLADEQVVDGKCERCSSIVEKRELEQWFFKITAYADKLLDGLNRIDWTEKVKIAQRNWIGKKEGISIRYKIVGTSKEIVCWTSRPDTNFGATFIVLAPENPHALEITTKDNKKTVESYIRASKHKSPKERIIEGRGKTGAFTGSYAINDLTGERMPIWVSDFVVMEFGTGAVVGVPGSDRRDFEFAQKFHLPIKRVVIGKDGDTSPITKIDQVQEGEGTVINSDFLDGLDIHKATKKIMDYLKEKGWGKRVTTYHLRDWLISRQRYWGPPIPMINCPKCGWQPTPEKNLPVLLPDVKDWRPKGTGKSPLVEVSSFVATVCPKCGGKSQRETDVSDTFLDSAWYFLRYISTEFNDRAWDKKRAKRWLPVDMYIGGAEHSVLHLLYVRFLTKVFKDLGLVEFDEPFPRFYAHGLLISEGAKMSKSRANVVIPDEYIKQYGADSLRSYLMFLGPFSEGGDFQDRAINGIYHFLQRVWGLYDKVARGDAEEAEDLRMMHKTIKKVSEDLENLKFNTAIAALMEWLNHLSKKREVSREEYKTLLLLLAPFVPHITEQLWSFDFAQDKQNWSIHQQSWPQFDNKYLQEEQVNVVVQVNGKVRQILVIQKDAIDNKEVVEKFAKESTRVKKFLDGKSVKKTVYVPGKIINFVI